MAFVWGLAEEIIDLPLGCLQGGYLLPLISPSSPSSAPLGFTDCSTDYSLVGRLALQYKSANFRAKTLISKRSDRICHFFEEAGAWSLLCLFFSFRAL